MGTAMIKLIRRWLCSHAVYIEDIYRPDPNKTEVNAPCCKCGKLLSAEYGLALNATLHRKEGAKQPTARGELCDHS